MNFDVFLLFFNATLTTVLSAVIVIWILRKQYLPVIKRLEQEQSDLTQSTEDKPSQTHFHQ
ncbi:hypothetical protein GCM10010965_30490 [Caldalkalibacillus thermarum]|uniref:hypothetical protein n=1 Tax=Caldalkalibacillus thermarum TaxID=296745 RepID=UPI00166C0042|nr:hypothetical protein [Caldalkalibacillus thermarum]GGK35403.1 hypothetical protein GCM10010965_30490 [Caldalkalibacillus thermarum]